ncbi:hypothetical protein NKH77_28925 [Streptomyces sp. M19]
MDEALGRLGTVDLTAEAVRVLELSGPDKVGEAERSWMFWASVKAGEWLDRPGTNPDALTARLLHLRPWDAVGDAEHEQARSLVTAAFARGRELPDTDAAAAYHLETLGAYADTTSVKTSVKTVSGTEELPGRDYTGTPGTAKLDLSKISTPGGLEDAPWAGKDQDGDDQPIPYMVRVEVDPRDSKRLLVTFGGATRRVPAGEFAELLANDPGCSKSGCGPAAAGRPTDLGPVPAARPAARPHCVVDRPAGGHLGDRRRGEPGAHAARLVRRPDEADGGGLGDGRPAGPATPGGPAPAPPALTRSGARARPAPPSGEGAPEVSTADLSEPGTPVFDSDSDAGSGSDLDSVFDSETEAESASDLDSALDSDSDSETETQTQTQTQAKVGAEPKAGASAPASRGGRILTRILAAQPTSGPAATAPASPVHTAPVTARRPPRPRCCRRRRTWCSRPARRARTRPARTTCCPSPCGSRWSRCATGRRRCRCRRSPSGATAGARTPCATRSGRPGRGAADTPAGPADGRTAADGG